MFSKIIESICYEILGINMAEFQGFVSVSTINKNIQHYQYQKIIVPHYYNFLEYFVTMKPIAIILFITLSCMAMQSIMAKYLLVEIDQHKTESKFLER